MTAQLHSWGIQKNIKKEQALTILQEIERRKNEGKDTEYSIDCRPVDLRRVERHAQRARFSKNTLWASQAAASASTQVTCSTPPPTVSAMLLREEQWRIPEKLIFDVERLIISSFESGIWRSNGKDQIIRSSEDQSREKQLLHGFLGSLISGTEAANDTDMILAGAFWSDAFQKVDHLVQGQYHDIIPNLIQKINDLNAEERGDLASLLQKHIADCGQQFLAPSCSTQSFYVGLGQLDMVHMIELEERMMKGFNILFDKYLGQLNYNSFVMMMNHARRRIYRDPCVRLEDVLPPIDHLDRTFGMTDRRTLDVIAMRVEVSAHRNMLEQVQTEATIFIRRAEMIVDDDWVRFYNLTRGWNDLGCAQYVLRKKQDAMMSFDNALASDDALRNVDEGCNIHDPLRKTITKYKQIMESW